MLLTFFDSLDKTIKAYIKFIQDQSDLSIKSCEVNVARRGYRAG